MNVTIVDYGNSNAHSIIRSLDAIGVTSRFSGDAQDIVTSEHLILPGVGHAGTALSNLRARGLIPPLEEAVFGRGARVLGICLGMQIMVDHVEEGACDGLGWIRGRAVQMRVDDRCRYKVPHIGWNSVSPAEGSRLLPVGGDDPSFYFCHKFLVEDAIADHCLSSFHYEQSRIACFEHGNIFGVQFHPEKSQAAGHALFNRFFGKD